MKIAIITDTHCGIRNSSEIFLENAARFYSNIFFPHCVKNNIKHILHLGDFYENRKFVNFKALNHNRKNFLNPLRENGMTMDIIPGNHDTYYKNTNELNSLKIISNKENEICISYEKNKINIGEIINLLKKANVQIYDITTDDGDLEDVFLLLTKN